MSVPTVHPFTFDPTYGLQLDQLRQIRAPEAPADFDAMRDGRVIADGTPDAVLTEDNLEAIFGYRMQIEQMGGKPFVLHHL